MNKTKQLFVRACKSNNPLTRVKQVYRRFYCGTENSAPHIARILSDICDEYLSLKAIDLIDAFNPENQWRYGISPEDSHALATIKILVSKIQLTEKDRFEGLTSPAIFRNN